MEKEAIKAVIGGFLETNIEELSTIERPEITAFLLAQNDFIRLTPGRKVTN